MTAFVLFPLRLLLLAAALAVTPWLFVRRFRPQATPIASALSACLLALVLNALLLLTLHALRVPIVPLTLGCAHAALLCFAIVLSLTSPSGEHPGRVLPLLPAEPWLLMGLFLLLVFPYTHLAGIDTYKWQNTASAIRVDENISWLIHPLSLLGFTPRSYPCLQPFLLATVQILGGLGVKGGFAVVSLFSGFLAAVAALHLGQRVFTDNQKAAVFAFLYLFAPLFVRYNHWATGRGLLMALLPAFLYALVFERGARRVFCSLLLAALTAAAHKTGTVAAVLLPIVAAGSILAPTGRVFRLTLFAVACAAGLAFSPGMLLPGPFGRVAGVTWFALTRFGLLLPLGLLGLWHAWSARRFLQVCLIGLIVWLPPAFHSRAYAALVALPFAAVAAAFGVFQLEELLPWPRHLTRRLVLGLCLALAVATVVHRSSTAAPSEVVTAARLLESMDPLGPYELVAPGLARRQIQAYVSGCPRMALDIPEKERIHIGRPPTLIGPPDRVTQNWITYLRGVFELSDLEVHWYGRAPRRYYVVIDGQGERPVGAVRLAHEGNVEIYGAQTER